MPLVFYWGHSFFGGYLIVVALVSFHLDQAYDMLASHVRLIQVRRVHLRTPHRTTCSITKVRGAVSLYASDIIRMI